jgi:O-antigen ligase
MMAPVATDRVMDEPNGPVSDPDAGESTRVPPSPSLTFDDWAALAFCVALAIVAMPFAHFPDSTPRMVVVLCALPLGLVSLAAAVRHRDRAAIAATAFVVWAVVCAWFADARGMALLGSFGRDTSALVVAAGFGLWAIGRRVSERGRALAPHVLLACMGLSACFGVLQVLIRASGGGLFGLVGGRAHGLGGGHIYFGATMAGAACLVAVTQRARTWQWCGLVFVFAACANLSGSRFPVAVGLVGGIIALGLRRELKSVLAWSGIYVAAVLVSSYLLSLVPGTESAADRAGSEASGRFDAWQYAWNAFLERPVFGWGPVGFRGAVQGRFTPEFTALHAQNELSQIWWDAHNVIVGVTVSYGVIGIALVTWFTVVAARSARGPLAVFAAVVATTWLLEPAGLATFPLVMVCLGIAMAARRTGDVTAATEVPGPSVDVRRLLLLAGCVFGSLYLLTDMRLERATTRRDPDAVAAAARWAPWDPVAANTAAAAYANFDGSEPALRTALEWMEKARDRQPDFPFYSNKIAQLRMILGDDEGARVALDDALELQPWNVTSLQLMYVLADRTDDDALLTDMHDRLCTLGSDFCPPPDED